MDTETALNTAETLTQPWSQKNTRPESNRLDVYISSENLVACVQALVDAKWGYLAAITGLDHPTPAAEGETVSSAGSVELLYSFCEGAAIITLRTSAAYEAAVVPTICNVIPSATLYEREIIELFGVAIDGTPDSSHLILPEDWPDGVYPLRKSFTGLAKQASA